MSHLNRRQTNSLAGWLFADLSIVLALVFMSSQMRSAPVDLATDVSTTTTTTTTTEVLSNSGVSVEPIELIFEISSSTDSLRIQAELERALTQKGISPNIRFGVVLVLAGPIDSSQEAQSSAQERSRQIARALETWDRLTPRYWVNGNGSDKGINYPEVKVRLLEDLSNP
jgi:hypothetical protein